MADAANQSAGRHKGQTVITVEGTLRYGSMSGTIVITFPDEDRIVFIFDGWRK